MSKYAKLAATNKSERYDPATFLESEAGVSSVEEFEKGRKVFSQGDVSDSLYYIRKGQIKVSVVSKHGKEAVIALLSQNDFLGEGCLIGQTKRLAAATTVTDCSVLRITKLEMQRLLRHNTTFSQFFIGKLLAKNARIEDDLLDQLFNSTERRLARVLLLLANFDKEGRPEPVVTKLSQETLAEMIGTTRSRVSFFMNKFRRLGFIEYNGTLEVNSSLLSVLLTEPSRSVLPTD